MDTKPKIINLSQNAKEEISRLLSKETTSPDGLRISLLAGGCSGLSYHLEFDKLKEKDITDEVNGIKIIIDPKSALYITGMTLDFQGGLTGKGFTFNNPNAKKSCGCGTSFSVDNKEVVLEFVSNKKPSNVCPSGSEQSDCGS